MHGHVAELQNLSAPDNSLSMSTRSISMSHHKKTQISKYIKKNRTMKGDRHKLESIWGNIWQVCDELESSYTFSGEGEGLTHRMMEMGHVIPQLQIFRS